MVNNGELVRVILADDDEDDCMLFADVAQELKAPMRLTCVTNGIELHRSLEVGNNLPDIIFLDLNMPLKNGMDCLRDIRRDTRFMHLPVIIFSTSAQQDTVLLAFETGADMYVKKPSSIVRLRDILNKILSIHADKALTRQPWDRFLID